MRKNGEASPPPSHVEHPRAVQATTADEAGGYPAGSNRGRGAPESQAGRNASEGRETERGDRRGSESPWRPSAFAAPAQSNPVLRHRSLPSPRPALASRACPLRHPPTLFRHRCALPPLPPVCPCHPLRRAGQRLFYLPWPPLAAVVFRVANLVHGGHGGTLLGLRRGFLLGGWTLRPAHHASRDVCALEPALLIMCTCWNALDGAWLGSCWWSKANGAAEAKSSLHDSGNKQDPILDDEAPSQQVILREVGSKSSEEIRQGGNLRIFSYQDLKSATRNFRPDSLLGEGGFGSVYKGWIDEHGTTAAKAGTGLTVAVKQLNQEGLQGHREWLAEVNFLGQLHHPNLVKLIGYCSEDDQRLLVYEFMPRGSLENHLFRKGVSPLPWLTRMKIALGAASGLAFLHEAVKPVIYRDFKTSNILLDSDYTAKLSDFGLAKDGPEGDKTHVSTRVMGTYGYAAPEYVMTGHLTSRSDVYSFGVVLLEMLTGRRSVDKNRPSGEQNLVEWARPYLNDKRKFYKLIDPRLDGQYSVKGAQKAAILSHHCLSRDPKSRPLMGDVVDTLKPLQDMRDMASSSSHQSSNKYAGSYQSSSHQNGHGAGRNYHNGHGQKKYEQLRNIPVRTSGVSPLPSY